MKKMKNFSFRWKDNEGKTHYDNVVAINFATAVKGQYGDNVPDFEYVSSDEVNVILPNE